MAAFPDQIRAWLEAALADGIPSGVVAFAFNLYEAGATDARYGVEFIGASKFDPDNTDWACAEVWEPAQGRSLAIPLSYCDGGWEDCLTQMRGLITSILSERTRLSDQLRAVRGIGLGFVDGDLELL